jgi:hypothetical protein
MLATNFHFESFFTHIKFLRDFWFNQIVILITDFNLKF